MKLLWSSVKLLINTVLWWVFYLIKFIASVIVIVLGFYFYDWYSIGDIFSLSFFEMTLPQLAILFLYCFAFIPFCILFCLHIIFGFSLADLLTKKRSDTD